MVRTRLKQLMISFNLMHINFIYLPTEIWKTTRSRSSHQGYFQLSFLWKDCKWTSNCFFVYYFMTDLEGSKGLFWHLWIEGGWGAYGWRGGSTVDYLPIVWLCFSAFLSLQRVSFNHSPLVHISQKQPFLDWPKFRIIFSSVSTVLYLRIPPSSLLLFL